MHGRIPFRFEFASALVVVIAVGGLTACREEVTPPPAVTDEDAAVSVETPAGHGPGQMSSLGESDQFLAPGTLDRLFYEMNLELPGFAGLHYDTPPGPGLQGTPIVRMTVPGADATARDLVRPFMEARGSTMAGFRVEPADYEWRELANWRFHARGLMAIPGLTMIGISARKNRIEVGVDSDAAADEVRTFLEAVEVPLEAVSLVRASPGVPTAGRPGPSVGRRAPRMQNPTLTDHHRPALGGTSITTPWEDDCSLGPDVDGIVPASFLTASHCTQTKGQVTGWMTHQPSQPDTLGKEVDDPPLFQDGDPQDVYDWCEPGELCRYADAARFEYNDEDDAALSRIAKPSLQGMTDVDGTFFITGALSFPIENETLHRVGIASGWVSGAVLQTCHAYVFEYDTDDSVHWLLCQSRFDVGAASGDSGSPVFRRESLLHTHVTLFGVNVGVFDGASVFAPMWSLEEHFGYPIDPVTEPAPTPPSVGIDGPDEILPEAVCTWTANLSGGTAPFTYEWRIHFTLVSDSASYTGGRIGGASNPFPLKLEVKDVHGQKDTDELWVTETSLAPECLA